MKNLILAGLFLFTGVSQAESLKASADPTWDILYHVQSVTTKYSAASNLDAKVFELLVGDGTNPYRMILVLNDIYGNVRNYELGIMMVGMRRMVFSGVDEITINYTQDDIRDTDDKIETVPVNLSLKIKIKRNKDGSLANEIELVN